VFPRTPTPQLWSLPYVQRLLKVSALKQKIASHKASEASKAKAAQGVLGA